MKRTAIIILLSSFIICLSYAQDQNNRERMIEKVEAQRIAYITTKLDLSSDESAKFWPVYNEYSKKRMEIKRQKRENRIESRMNEKSSAESVDEQIELDEKELQLKKSYYEKFKTLLPSQKLARLEEAEQEFNREILRRIKERRKN